MIQKALIFDIDGTLLDLQKAESRAYSRAFEVCFGLTGISDDWDSYPAHTDIALAKDLLYECLGRPCLDWEWRKVMEAYSRLLRTEAYQNGKALSLVPCAQALLNILADRKDLGLALATGNARDVAELRLAEAGIWHYFQCGGFAEDGDSKSLILCQSISRCRALWSDLDAGDIIYLGDRESDRIVALGNGTHFIKIAAGQNIITDLGLNTYAHFLKLDDFLSDLTRIWGN